MSGTERIGTFTRDGLVFDVRDEGPIDGTPVVLLHGFPQDSRSWDALAPLLHRRGFRTLAPDQRGYSAGARPRARWAYRTSELVADVVALIDQAGLGPAHVVGHDWGAAVAWGIAAERPDRVRTLTALSVPHPAAFVRAMVTSRQILKSWYMFAFQLPWIPERVIASDRFGYRALRASGQSVGEAKRDLESMRDRTRARGALNWYRAMPFTAPRSASRKVRVPTLLVWSDGDTAIGPVGPALTSRFVDGPYTYEVLHGVSHWIPDEAAVRVDELLGNHLLDQS
ncbi:alpha/beta fold hydrolase [Rhodococcus wratislaviensis]|uniref:Putative epoxide hydrolase n=1 Tax=Rhodococcus wratislaviensis NBRC 100605 TaxID=1219028 RepID=X0RBS0_RHOWR|nr:alpha/beta fold hydrolase [Rhodococcus wratislaviensis]GAF48445.1 putative epoxide hydrolase [Rhodococcus wratislaviensis NBRC 100605]